MPKVNTPAQSAPAATMFAATQSQPTMPAMSMALPPGAPPPMIGNSAEEFVSTGLANNFLGRVVGLWYVPRKYPIQEGKGRGAREGKKEAYSLTALLQIQADDHSLGQDGLVSEAMRMDDLSQWVPSRTDPQWNGQQWVYTPAGSIQGTPATLDNYMMLHNGAGFPTGKTLLDKEGRPVLDANGQPVPETMLIAPEDWWGWFAVPGLANNRARFKDGTKWAHFKGELIKLGYQQKAPHVNWSDFRQLLVGVYGKWVRVPFEFKGGGTAPKMADGQTLDTLCLTEILDLGPISGTQGPQAMPAVAVSAQAFAAPAAVATNQAQAQMFAQPTAPAPLAVAAVPTPTQPVQQVAPSATRNDPAAISAAANEILTLAAQQKGVAGLSKEEAGKLVFEGVNARGLDGATALRLLNDQDYEAGWMVGAEREFWYIPAKGKLAGSEEWANAIAAS